MSSMVQAMQSLRSGPRRFRPRRCPASCCRALAKDPTLDLVSVYKWLPRQCERDRREARPARSSPRRSWPAKRIGVRNQGDPGIVVTKTMLAELGLKDDGTEYIAIGDGAPAGGGRSTNDRVDAMVTFDTAAPRASSWSARSLRLRAAHAEVRAGGARAGSACPRKDGEGRNARRSSRCSAAIAKSTLFAHTATSTAAIDLHWAVYPESRPKGPQRGRGAQGARVHPEGPQGKLDAARADDPGPAHRLR